MTNHPEPTRRDFLAASAFSLLGLTSRATGVHVSVESAADSQLLYVGTYTEGKRTEGVHLARMDIRSGDLQLVRSFDAGANPSFLAIHPNGKVLYAVSEVDEREGKPTGAVGAFAILRDTGELTRINEQPSEGAAPCYVSVDRKGRVVLVANYNGGNVALLPIEPSGALSAATSVEKHSGRGPNAERQEGPHAHCVVADPSNRFALAVDLGIDRVVLYRLDVGGRSLRHMESGDAMLKPGAGPRHLAFHPHLPLVYVANELDSTVTTLRLERDDSTLAVLGTRSTLPDGWSGTSYVADIHVAPSGRTLYVSNRGHNSIAVFAIGEATGLLALEQVVSTGGDWPRNFSLDPTGRWLVVGNQRSGSVVVLQRDQATGRLTPTGKQLTVAAPACVRFRQRVGVTA